MKHYIGTKVVTAQPMTRAEYNEYRNWELPANENGADKGYLVEYTDGGKGNDSRHAGYISWSPKKQFDDAYRETTGLTFGLALEALKKGDRVMRLGWNGNGMWLRLVNPTMDKQYRITEHEPDPRYGDSGTLLPYIGMHTAQNGFVPWLASQTDMLAEDWVVLR